MTKNRYVFKTTTNSDPIDISWNEAQEWCNFVLFKSTRLPEGLIKTSNTIRPESSGEESSHRTEFNDENRSLSIKQFLYDWAPPAYDHPCLWRNAKISAPENTPLPSAHLVGNNYFAYWTVELCQNALIQSETIEWAMTALQQTEINTEIVVQTPWSSVVRINAGNELFYLKTTPALIALESEIIKILHDQFHAPVPTVIAHNAELHCFLMKDCGTSLRSILKKKFDTDLLCKAIEQFTALQITVADHVDDFIDIGVLDWRLNKLPDLYKEAISQKDLLMADGLSELEVNELEELLPKINYLCQKLSGYAIKQTIVQPDFNDNNTLIDDKSQAITIIDLGEISISHPFFSLLNCLHVIKKHHALTNEDEAYLKAKDACLKNYMQFESEKNVADALKIAHVLWFVYELLAHDRLMQACGREQLMSFQHGKLSHLLKDFMVLCKTIE